MVFNEFICVFRRYCELEQEDVAAAARIPLETYLDYEYGLADPSNEELQRIAAVFGLEERVFELGIEPIRKTYEMFEPRPADENIFETAEDLEKVRLLVNKLSPDEARLVLFYRSADSEHKSIIAKAAADSLCGMGGCLQDEID